MCESRTVPSGKLYRQLFDAQVQLSRCLRGGHRDTRTECLSAEDSNTDCSTTSSRRQQVDDDDDGDDEVSRLPDTVAVEQHSSHIMDRLLKKRQKKQDDVLRRLKETLEDLSQDCECAVRTAAQQLLSSLQDVDSRLDGLTLRAEDVAPLSLQEVCVVWQQVVEELNVKKVQITEFGAKLRDCERGRTLQIRASLRSCCQLLENIGLLRPEDVHRLLHREATMLNQSLLANRRCTARLLLRLQEEALQQEALLRRRWEEQRSLWRSSRAQQEVQQQVQHFRSLCTTGQDQDPVLDLDLDLQLLSVQRDLAGRRDDVVRKISSLAPPTCSLSLVSDWFDELSAVNQLMDGCHADLLQRWRCGLDQVFQRRLAQAERCKEALLALQLREEEVNGVLGSQLLPLIGRRQKEDEERLAAVDVCSDQAARHALHLSRVALDVMRAAASLWETHQRRLAWRHEELQRHLEDVRRSHQQDIQRKKAEVDDLLGALRQDSSEDAARETLDKAVLRLQDVHHSCTQCVSSQWDVLDSLPSVLLDDLVSYSRSLSSFFRLSHAYQPSPEELHKLHPSIRCPAHLDPVEVEEDQPITCQSDVGPAHSAQDWLTESSLLEFYDVSSDVSFMSSGGVVYTGPAFRCPALPEQLQQDTHLSVFPVELLTHTLSRTRTGFLDHLEQHFADVLKEAVAVATERKEAAHSEQELQLQQLDAGHVQKHVYQPRLAELQLHRQQVDVHCQDMLDIRASCRTQLQRLQDSVSRRNQDFITSLSDMEAQVQTPVQTPVQTQVQTPVQTPVQTTCSSQRLQDLSSTLQDRLDEHIRETQLCVSSFRRSVSTSLETVRTRTAQLLASFRLFSEGGDFSPQEVKTFQRRLKEDSRQTDVEDESVSSELETLQSRSLQQVKEAAARLEEKLSALKSKATFTEKIREIMSSTQVRIQAEKNSSNQQQSVISSKLQDLRRMLQSSQVFPDQICELLSSLIEDMRTRCQYLDVHSDLTLQENKALRAASGPRVRVAAGPPPGLLQASRRGLDLQQDPAVVLLRSLSRFTSGSSAKREDRGAEPGQRSQQHRQRSSRSVNALRRVQASGIRLDLDLGPRSLGCLLNAALQSAAAALLHAAEEFSCLTRFQLLPEPLDQWADSMKQRLLGYQEEASRFLRTSREEVLKQLLDLDQLLDSVPEVLIRNHEDQQGAGLKKELGGVRQKLVETLTASEKEKALIVDRLRVSLRDEDLQTLDSRETLRQQQLHDATCRTHLELQECARVRGEEFVTSLSSLTEKLLPLLDEHSVTMETRTHHDATESSSNVTTATISSSQHTQRRLRVSAQRDAAVERFQQLVQLESSRSDDDRRRQLSQQHSWNTHWREEIHTLRHTLQ